jgi:uncharacterized membrane protein YfcA
MLLGSAPMSLAGVALATWLEHAYGDDVKSVGGRVLGGALLAGGLGLLAKSFIFRDRAERVSSIVLTRRDRLVAFGIGFFGGFIVGLTSVGSGVFFGLTMLLAFPLRSSKVVGTDIFHAAALLWVAGIGHLVGGNVDLGATAWLLVGSIPGVLLGSQLTVRLPDRTLRAALALVLFLAGVKLVDPPYADAIVVAVASAALAAGAAIGALRLLRPSPAPAGAAAGTRRSDDR